MLKYATLFIIYHTIFSVAVYNDSVDLIKHKCEAENTPAHMRFIDNVDFEDIIEEYENITYSLLTMKNPPEKILITKSVNIEDKNEIKIIANELKIADKIVNHSECYLYHTLQSINDIEKCFYEFDDKFTDKLTFTGLLFEGFDDTLGSLLNSYKEKSFIDSVPWKIYMTLTLARLLKRFHDMNFLHGKITSHTIFFRNMFEPVLGDFEYTIDMNEINEKYSDTCFIINQKIAFTPYAAPEVTNNLYCKESDSYSLGIILYRLWTKDRQNITESTDEFYKRLGDYCKFNYADLSIENAEYFVNKQVYCKYYHEIVLKMTKKTVNERLDITDALTSMEKNIDNTINKYYIMREDLDKKLEKQKIEVQKLESKINKHTLNGFEELNQSDQDKLKIIRYRVDKLEEAKNFHLSPCIVFSELIEKMLKLRKWEKEYQIRWLEDNDRLIKSCNFKIDEMDLDEYLENLRTDSEEDNNSDYSQDDRLLI